MVTVCNFPTKFAVLKKIRPKKTGSYDVKAGFDGKSCTLIKINEKIRSNFRK